MEHLFLPEDVETAEEMASQAESAEDLLAVREMLDASADSSHKISVLDADGNEKLIDVADIGKQRLQTLRRSAGHTSVQSVSGAVLGHGEHWTPYK